MDMPEAVLMKILEVSCSDPAVMRPACNNDPTNTPNPLPLPLYPVQSCGKLFKLTRPVDPATQLPAAFALATYSQGLCALRCVRALNGYLVDEEEDIRLVVKVSGVAGVDGFTCTCRKRRSVCSQVVVVQCDRPGRCL